MDTGFIEIAERLGAEFADLPGRVVIRTLTRVHDEHPTADQWFVEEAARARLLAIRRVRFR